MTKPNENRTDRPAQKPETKPTEVPEQDLDAVAGGFIYKYNNG